MGIFGQTGKFGQTYLNCDNGTIQVKFGQKCFIWIMDIERYHAVVLKHSGLCVLVVAF